MTDEPLDDADDLSEPDLAAPRRTVAVPEEAAGQRLDKFLAAALAEEPDALSRSRLQALLDAGHVSCGGRTITDASQRVKPGQVFDIFVPEPETAVPEPQAIPLNVVYEDDDLLVVDKPAGMVVHPAAGSPDRTLVNALLAHCGDRLSGIGGVRRPGIVHRLDKDTSGLMVVAKTDRAHRHLTAQFGERTIRRTYRGVVWGVPTPTRGEIAGDIGRHPTDRKRMAVVERGGKPALTRYRTLRAYGTAAALVECRLETGRTHQIRVHMAAIGHPLVGDPVYGRIRSGRLRGVPEAARVVLTTFPRQALHAVALEFIHPASGQPLRFTSDSAYDIQDLTKSLERF